MTVSPPCSYYERDSLGGGSEVATPSFIRMDRHELMDRYGAKSISRTPEHVAWRGMKRRCLMPQSPKWRYYGGRGIKICNRWLESFDNFLADMGARPTPKHSIDRINNDGNYEPANCQWATYTQQNNNQNKTMGSSGVVGVKWSKSNKNWIAVISINSERKVVYSGKDFEAAVVARKLAQQKKIEAMLNGKA